MTPDEKIADLEIRLAEYHEWLVESIEQRDRLAIDAAWGVHYGLYAALATIGTIFAAYHFLGTSAWFWTVFAVALSVVPVVVHFWSNGQRMKEVERFAKLPSWRWPD